MKITDSILKFAGKEGFSLDPAVSKEAFARQCFKYGKMAAKGKMYSLLKLTNGSSSVFIGKNVVIQERRNIRFGNKVKLHDGVFIDALSTEGVSLGDGVVLGRNSRIECTGSLSKLGKGVKIGSRTTFGSDCYFGAAGGIEIGEDVVAGQHVRFHSENHVYSDTEKLIREQGVTHKGIVIGNNCWIGAGAVFLDGAEIGDGSVVAANAVVTKSFPPNSVIGGVPAKLIKTR